MRKGKLIVRPAKKFKAGDRYFDKSTKVGVTVKEIKDGSVFGVTTHDQPCKVSPKDLVELVVKDRVTEEKFNLDESQWAYMYKTCREHDFMFYNKTDYIEKTLRAIVFAKNNDLTAKVRELEPIVDAYGKYVASQKAIGEGAKGFGDWYFDVSV